MVLWDRKIKLIKIMIKTVIMKTKNNINDNIYNNKNFLIDNQNKFLYLLIINIMNNFLESKKLINTIFLIVLIIILLHFISKQIL